MLFFVILFLYCVIYCSCYIAIEFSEKYFSSQTLSYETIDVIVKPINYDCENTPFIQTGKECPAFLKYPCYKFSIDCIHTNLIVMPCKKRSTLESPPLPILEDGILFYVYSDNNHYTRNRYMEELEFNIDAIKAKDTHGTSNIALVTNCDVPLSIAKKLTVIVPVHDEDLIKGQRQWYTRVLYNAYSPFNYSFILDTHVFPCYNTSYSRLFELFKQSNVDISMSNRMNIDSFSGGAVLSKWGPASFEYWKRNVLIMMKRRSYDDQGSAIYVLQNRKGYSFKQLSSNWFFASHGISKDGEFIGSDTCYRSSIVVTGPVQWIHGSPEQCALMNTHPNQHRVYFLCGTCSCNQAGPAIATSSEELQQFVGKSKTPLLLWERDDRRSSEELFWY